MKHPRWPNITPSPHVTVHTAYCAPEREALTARFDNTDQLHAYGPWDLKRIVRLDDALADIRRRAQANELLQHLARIPTRRCASPQCVNRALDRLAVHRRSCTQRCTVARA
jgi:hypothetical protein